MSRLNLGMCFSEQLENFSLHIKKATEKARTHSCTHCPGSMAMDFSYSFKNSPYKSAVNLIEIYKTPTKICQLQYIQRYK